MPRPRKQNDSYAFITISNKDIYDKINTLEEKLDTYIEKTEVRILACENGTTAKCVAIDASVTNRLSKMEGKINMVRATAALAITVVGTLGFWLWSHIAKP